MAGGENTNSVSAVVFLVISVLFLFMVHVNGLVFQVPEDNYYSFLFVPLPLVSTISSMLWLHFHHRGVSKGGYVIDLTESSSKMQAQQ